MGPGEHPPWQQFGLALCAVALATLVRLALDPWLGDQLPILIYFVSIAFAALYCDPPASLTALVAGAAASRFFFFRPRHTLALDGSMLLVMAAYLAAGGAIVALGGLARHRARLARAALALADEEADACDAAAAELERQREWFRVALTCIGDAVVTTDAAGVVTFVNPVAEALTGWAGPDAVGRPLAEVYRVIDERTRKPAADSVERALAAGHAVGLAGHAVLIARDGTERPIDDSASPLRDAPDGPVVGAVLTFHDVAERRRAEKQLNDSLALLRGVIDGTPDPIFTKDRAGRYRLANRATAAAFDRTPEEVVGRTDAELMPAAAARPLAETDGRVAANGAAEVNLEFLPGAGGTRAYLTSKTPWRDAAGEVLGIIGVARDVTERHRQEELLRESEERYRVLTEVSPQAVWMATAAGEFTYFNRYWYDATGLTPGRSAGSGWLAAVHPDHRDGVRGVWSWAVETASDFEVEFPLRLAGGAFRWHLARGRAVRGPDGRVTQWVGVALDVEDHRRMEEQLRTADRRKDEFLAVLAHELRNPLAPLRHNLEILRVSDDPALAEAARGVMGRQLGQLARLVDDLMDVSRIGRGKVALRPERIDVGSAARVAVEANRPVLAAARHEFALELPAEPAYVEADPARLAQILANLLQNAAKYTPPGGKVRLAAAREGDEVVLRVSDTGVGLAPEMLERIFEPFAQVGGSLERSQGGLGIGLTLVRSLVELHGGTVAATSAGPNRGTEVVVRLPAAEAPPPADGRAPPANGPARRVVVADDNVDAARSLATLLRLMGHAVREAHDGPSALAACAEFAPEVVLLDLGMPGMSGYEVARALRGAPATAGAVLAALTGWGSDDDRRRTRDAGFDRHLTKPADPDEIQALLAELPPRG